MTEEEVKEILKGEFTLDIPNFEKWNPATKNKRQWIKLDNHWHCDPRIRMLGPSFRLAWVLLLNLRGSSSGVIAGLTRGSIQDWVNIRGTSVEVLIAKLVNSQLLTIQKLSLDREIDRERQTGKTAAAGEGRLTQRQIQNYEKAFGVELVREKLAFAVGVWDSYDAYRQSRTPLNLSVLRTLESESEKRKKEKAKTQTPVDQDL